MKNIVKILLAVLTGSRACSRSEKRTSLFFSFLIAAFTLSLVPTTYVCAQGSIETPAERKAREAREVEARRKKQQQEAAARRQREEDARQKREAEEQAVREAVAREQAEREQIAREREEHNQANKKWIFQNDFFEGLAMVSNGKIGFVDKTGKLVISCQWHRATDFEDGIAWVANANDEWGFIDKTGKVVCPCRWKKPAIFFNGFASVEDFNGNKHKIDKTGNIVE